MLNKGLYLILLSVCACGVTFAQGTTSRVLGTVQDASGTVIPAATVKLVNEGTRITFTITTTSAGSYVFEAVQPGSYELDVEAAGFRNFVSRGNDVAIGQPAAINIKLDVGAVTDQVEISGSSEVVQTSTSGNYGNLVSQEAVMVLPIVGTRGRNPLDLVLMQPSVVSGAPTGGSIYVHGARDRSWNYTLDGIEINVRSVRPNSFYWQN
jgi:hypothetical protein